MKRHIYNLSTRHGSAIQIMAGRLRLGYSRLSGQVNGSEGGVANSAFGGSGGSWSIYRNRIPAKDYRALVQVFE